MKLFKVAALVCAVWVAFLLMAGTAQAAPQVDANVVQPYVERQVFADTLARFSTDSVTTTDSVFIKNARALFLYAQSSSSTGDSLALPTLQTRAIDRPGQWEGNVLMLMSSWSGPNFTDASNIVQTPSVVWGYVPDTGSSGAPLPITGLWVRWRVKSSDLRRYATASSATLAATGTITLRAVAWGF